MMNKKSITIDLLKEAESTAIKRALEARDNNQYSEKIKWESRRKYITRELRKYENLIIGSSVPPTVFISYSANTGLVYYKYMEKNLKERGFDVLTGFQRNEDDQSMVLKRVLKQIGRGTVYLGILTKEHKIQTGEEIKWSPVVWTVEEKGMALALEKPFVLMIENGVHDDFWKKTTPERVHFVFDKENFYRIAFEVIDDIVERYHEAMKRALGS